MLVCFYGVSSVEIDGGLSFIVYIHTNTYTHINICEMDDIACAMYTMLYTCK